jgi:hypothetical protein
MERGGDFPQNVIYKFTETFLEKTIKEVVSKWQRLLVGTGSQTGVI